MTENYQKSNQFSNLDIIGSTIGFKYNGTSNIRSTPGACLSLLFIIYCVYYFVIESFNYAVNTRQELYQVQQISQPIINFSDYPNFMLMHCKVDASNSTRSNMPEIDELVDETLTIQMITKIPQFVKQEIKIPVSQCTIDMFPPKIMNEKLFKNYYQYCKCVSNSMLRNYNVSFFYSDTYNTYLEFTTQIKQDIFNDKTKLSAAYKVFEKDPPISEFLFIDANAEPPTSKTPFSFYLNSQFAYMNMNSISYSEVLLKQIHMRSDPNIFFEGSKALAFLIIFTF